MKTIRTSALLALMSICVSAQVNVNGDRKFLGSVDTSNATMTQPFRLVETTPTGSCLLGWVETIDTGKLFRCRLGAWEEFSSGSGPGAVASVFGRTGNVVAQETDYPFFVRLSQAYSNPTWITSLDLNKITGAAEALSAKSDVGHTHSFDSIEDKPNEYPPEHHQHDPIDVFTPGWGLGLIAKQLNVLNSIIVSFEAASGSSAPVTSCLTASKIHANEQDFYGCIADAWVALARKVHTHQISNVDGLTAALAAKVDSSALSPHATRELLDEDIPNNSADTSGNAATATALASTPTICSSGQAPRGVLANGDATGCQSIGGGGGTDMFSSTPGATVPGGETGPPVVPAVRYTFFTGGVPSAFSTSRNTRENVMVSSGTVSNCYVNTSSAQTGSALVFVLYKNGVATDIEISITGSAAVFSDTTHTVTYSAGDLLSWQATNNSTATSAVVVSLNCRGN